MLLLITRTYATAYSYSSTPGRVKPGDHYVCNVLPAGLRACMRDTRLFRRTSGHARIRWGAEIRTYAHARSARCVTQRRSAGREADGGARRRDTQGIPHRWSYDIVPKYPAPMLGHSPKLELNLRALGAKQLETFLAVSTAYFIGEG